MHGVSCCSRAELTGKYLKAMKIHEYQAKAMLAENGIPVPQGGYALTAEEVAELADRIGPRVVVKAQVHAGGRGKAGGIKLVSSVDEARLVAKELIGSILVTHQTGPEGVPVRGLLVEEALDVERELYLGLVVDAAVGGVVVMASESGGLDIEEVADQTPEKIIRVGVDPGLGLMDYQARTIAYRLGLDAQQIRLAAEYIGHLYRMFIDNDCSLVEINPLVVTKDLRLLAADAKVNFDDDALFKHPHLAELHDSEQEEPLEVRAGKFGISYVKLNGDVGCMVNGAGLAMATMDVTDAVGASPANFLDVGGGADEEKVKEAMKILLSDPKVTRVLINIFGGILRCDIVARGLIQAAKEMPHAVRPMVVRMLGTNSEEGCKLLEDSGLDVVQVTTFAEAAEAIKVA